MYAPCAHGHYFLSRVHLVIKRWFALQPRHICTYLWNSLTQRVINKMKMLIFSMKVASSQMRLFPKNTFRRPAQCSVCLRTHIRTKTENQVQVVPCLCSGCSRTFRPRGGNFSFTFYFFLSSEAQP
jgi:hypothetical protein